VETKSLYEKVRTAEIGAKLEYNGKIGSVDRADNNCRECIYHNPFGPCQATGKKADGYFAVPCNPWNRRDGVNVIVRENKEGETC
jgi:hypothetical protein